MTKTEEFNKKLSSITDSDLYDLVDKELSKMCKSGGRSFRMCVPAQITDTDILISELLRRFKKQQLFTNLEYNNVSVSK